MTSTIDSSSRVLLAVSSTDGLKPFLSFGHAAFQGSAEVVILGVVVASGDAGQDAHRARTLRRRLRQLVRDGELTHARIVVRSAQSAAQAVRAAVLDEQPQLAVLPLTDEGDGMGGLDELAARPPCDTAFVRPGREPRSSRILLAARGGPQAELAMELALRLSRPADSELTLMHIDRPSGPEQEREREARLFRALLARCRRVTQVRQRTVRAEDISETILEEASHHDVLVLGAGLARGLEPPLGDVPRRIAREANCTAVVVKTGTPMDPAFFSGPDTPIDVIVDRWFADNTFHCREFSDLDALVAVKRRAGLRVSLGVMAREDWQPLRGIIETVSAELCERNPLLDEMVVFDRAGETVEPPFEPAPGREADGARRSGMDRGLAIWKSLQTLRGDIVAWIDGDLRNVHPRMVYGVVGPLLMQERLQYVKGFYQRPATSDEASFTQGSAQLTELTARPLLNLFFPELSGVVEPLCREHAIRRRALADTHLFRGQGVEVGLLIDLLQHFGLRSIAQSDLESRVGEDLSVSDLAEQAFSIVQVILKRRSEQKAPPLDPGQQTMKLILQQGERYRLKLVEAGESELPQLPEFDETAIG
jgi:glucosyl-3-phosphoglycerate synthase